MFFVQMFGSVWNLIFLGTLKCKFHCLVHFLRIYLLYVYEILRTPDSNGIHLLQLFVILK